MSGAVFFSGTFSTKGCPVFKESFTQPHCIHVRTQCNNACFMQAGQRLSLLDIKVCNNCVNNAQCQVSEFCPQKMSTFSLISAAEKKFALFALLFLKTFHHSNFIHSIFIIISITIITIINRSSFWIAWLCRVHFCLPSSWCFSGICLYHSAASQREPLFPHLFSLSPLMICSDRYDSWINMQT